MIEFNSSSISSSSKQLWVQILKSQMISTSEVSKSHIWDRFSWEHSYTSQRLAEFDDWWKNIDQLEFLNPYLDGHTQEISVHFPFLLIDHNETKSLEIERESFQASLEFLALKHKLDWNERTPFVSFDSTILSRQCRVTLCHAKTQANNRSPNAFFRFHIGQQTPILPTGYAQLKKLVQKKSNILIAGSTGSGKTTLLKNLINDSDTNGHIVTLEDTHELSFNHPLSTHFVSRPEEGFHLSDYSAYLLRMSPERIILGEMRGIEVVPFLLLMNTGHRGFMSTIHAESPVSAIHRLVLLYCLKSEASNIQYTHVLKLVCQNLDYVFYIHNPHKVEVIKVLGNESENVIYDSISL